MKSENLIGSIEKRLQGYCKVAGFHLDTRPDLYYDLVLVLEREEDSRLIRLVCKDVSNLRLEDFGGGLTQFRFLKIEDVSDQQWDRVRFRLRELEDSHFECKCFDLLIEA